MQSNPPEIKQVPRRKWRRAMVATTLLGGMLVSGAGLLPSAVMTSSHRDRILNAVLRKNGITATSSSGAGGWLSAIAFHDVRLTDQTGRLQCSIQSIRLSKSLLSLLTGGKDLGTITIVQPRTIVALDDEGHWPQLTSLEEEDSADSGDGAADSDEWDLAFEIQDSALQLSVPWRELPIVEVSGVDVTGDITTDDTGRWLTVQPIEYFDHEPLSERHTEQNLALVAPILSQTTSLSGEISATLDSIRLNLRDPEATAYPLSGVVTLHSAEARLRQDWAQQVSQMVGRTLGRDIPATLRILENSTVSYQVNEQGIHHDGLAFLLPDLVGTTHISSSGLVGFDERVDLDLGVQLPQLLPRGPFMAALSKMIAAPLKLKVTGTVSEPVLSGPAGMGVLDQMADNIAPGAAPAAPSVPDTVIDMIGSATSQDPQQTADGITGGILNIIRAAREARENAPPREPREPRPRKRRRNRL